MDNILRVPEYGIKNAYVFTNDNVKTIGRISYFPIYMVMFLEEKSIDFVDISLDKYRL